MRLLFIVGTRPQLIKLRPLLHASRKFGLEASVVDTGQHYDPEMSSIFLQDEVFSVPITNLSVSETGHAAQTAAMLRGLEDHLQKVQPNWVLVVGDTNSTLAGALTAAKAQVPLAHVEAGLRSKNRSMPEEINRLVVDHISDRLYAPTINAMNWLRQEGLGDRALLSGDVMADALLSSKHHLPRLNRRLRLDSRYFVATIHRNTNTDTRERLAAILDALSRVPGQVVLPTHPRLAARASQFQIPLTRPNFEVVKPLAHTEMLGLVSHSSGLITDSGGLQKEAYILKTLCTTLRSETEWPETLNYGWNVLCTQLSDLPRLVQREVPGFSDEPFGQGHASETIVQDLMGH